MRLFIAEKPSLATAIFNGLGGNVATEKKNGYYQHGDDIVTWCFGHMLELFDPQDYNPDFKKWVLADLPFKCTYPPKLKVKKDAKKQFSIIEGLVAKAASIVHAGDPDEEGCLLIDEIITYTKFNGNVKRLLISDLNDKPVKQALANLRPNEEFRGDTNSALARSIADQMFGYNLTRAFTLKAREKGYQSMLSVGRVQSAVLGLINQRTLANSNHSESFYYEPTADFDVSGAGVVKTKFIPNEEMDVDDKKRIIDENVAQGVIGACEGKAGKIEVNESDVKSTAAPLPFDLATLQIQCSQKWGFSADKTLSTIQSLYETHKLLTYPRSDCRYLSGEHFAGASEILEAITSISPALSNKTTGARLSLKHKAFNANKITAHHAIIPTSKQSPSKALSDDESNVYELVATSFIALFYPPSLRDTNKLRISCGGHDWVATQSVTTDKGWEALFSGEDASESKIDVDISHVTEADTAHCRSVIVTAKKTKPAKYFVESSLLAAMTKSAKWIKDTELRAKLELKDKDNSAEQGSIGTPATRAGILKKLAGQPVIEIVKMKGYKEKVWKTTQAGQEFCALLPPEIVVPDVSARWAGEQALIKKGELPILGFLGAIDKYLRERVDAVKENGVNITVTHEHHCPKCQNGMVQRTQKTTKKKFWACLSYPTCKTAFNDLKGKPDLAPKPTAKAGDSKQGVVSDTEKCELCEKPLERIPAKKVGRFWWKCTGCSARYFDDNKTEKPSKRIE